ncbi:MAG: hypothetical protein R3B49_06330 [Phycisphaerales bacterium]
MPRVLIILIRGGVAQLVRHAGELLGFLRLGRDRVEPVRVADRLQVRVRAHVVGVVVPARDRALEQTQRLGRVARQRGAARGVVPVVLVAVVLGGLHERPPCGRERLRLVLQHRDAFPRVVRPELDRTLIELDRLLGVVGVLGAVRRTQRRRPLDRRAHRRVEVRDHFLVARGFGGEPDREARRQREHQPKPRRHRQRVQAPRSHPGHHHGQPP